MKKSFKSILCVAAAAMTLASCGVKEIAPEVKPEGKVVYFGTEVNDLTKASLTTEDDANFIANWENNDVLNVSGFVFNEWYSDFSGTWDADKKAFAVTGADDYFDDTYDFIGVYPQAVEGVIDFGSARTQDGNNYAGKYDVMCSEATSLTLVEDETFVLPMDRQTAIAYFHLTSTLPEEEKVVSATLSVNENLAGSFIYDKGEIEPDATENSITLSFTNAPSVRDLKLWFNVFPGEYTGLTLEVETENHTLTIKNNKTVTYEQGMLYKVAANATAKYELKAEEVTIAGFLPKEDNADVDYKVTAKVTAITNTTFGNLTIEDQTGTLSVYGLTATKTADRRNDRSFASLELKVGDVITICGPHGTYDGKAQIGSTFDDTAVPAYYVSTLEVPSVVAEDIVDVPAAGVDSEIQDATYTAVEGWDYAVTVDGTVVTAAELDSESILYSVSANTGEARKGWIKFTFTNASRIYQHVETISVAQLTGVAPADWNATALAEIADGSEVVITMTRVDNEVPTTYALSRNNKDGQQATGANPVAVAVTVVDGKLSATPDDLLVWNISRDGENLVITPVDVDDDYLYTIDNNSGVRVGTSNSAYKAWRLDSDFNYLYESGLGRYLGVYSSASALDWRTYKLSSGKLADNIKDQTLVFYVKDDGKQVQSDFAFNPTNATATVGAEFTEPTLNGKLTTADVVYSSSNTEVATIDPSTGEVTLAKAGTTVIKAIAPADENYRQAVASYTLTVKHVLSSISLNTDNVKKEFNTSETFTSEGLVVTAHYNDNTEAVVTKNIEVVAPTMTEGEKTVIVRYTEDEVTRENSYTINVELFVIPTHLVKFSVNGTIVNGGGEGETLEEGADITFPSDPAAIGDLEFQGWVTTPIVGTTDTKPSFVSKTGQKVATGDITYYAVFASAGEASETWTKVAASAVNSAGVYAIITTDGHAFNGTISSGHGQLTSTAFSFDANGVATSAPSGTCEITFAAVTGGYTMYNASNGYLYASAASSGKLAWHNTESSYWLYKSSNWLYNSNSAYLRDYQNSSIRTYGANNGSVIQFAKKGTGSSTSGYCTTVEIPAQVVSIAISGNVTKTTYNADEQLSVAGLTVTGTLDNDTQRDLTNDPGLSWTFDPETLSAETTSCTATAHYLTLTDSYEATGLTVNAAPVPLTDPSDFACSNSGVSENSLTFTWTVDQKASGYEVKVGTGVWKAASGNGTHTETGLTAGTEYTLYIRAVGDESHYLTSPGTKSASGTTKSSESTKTEQEIYSTGFDETGFSSGSDYQGTVTTGPSGKQWKIYYGNVSTSSKITGTNSLALRLYTSNNYGYAETQFDLSEVTSVSYKAKAATSNSAKIKINTYYSLDSGSTWTKVDSDKTLTATATDYSFDVPTNTSNKVRIKFEISSNSTKPTKSNAQLTIDDIVIKGMK